MMKNLSIVIFLLLSSVVLASSNQIVMELTPTEKSSESFVLQMQESLPGNDAEQAIQNYLNSLLRVNAVYDRQNPTAPPVVLYRIQSNREGKLQVTRNELDQSGRQIDIRSLSVYGISNQLDYKCSWQEQLCWVIFPGKKQISTLGENERWLEISYAPHAINELVNGMGLLIKELQK